jgi:hypothetical protein
MTSLVSSMRIRWVTDGPKPAIWGEAIDVGYYGSVVGRSSAD